MKKLTVAVALSLISTISFAQNKFVIHGRIDLLSKSKHIRIPGYAEVPIQPDGTFQITGEVAVASIDLIMTDSSGADGIWLEPGEYTLRCKEITMPQIKGVLFRTSSLSGPANAELYNDFQQHQYSGFGVPAQAGGNKDSLNARRKKNAIQYMDSVIALDNASPVLANMVRSVQFFIGDEATESLVEKLAPAVRSTNDITMLEGSFKRKEKIRKEKLFENFTLKDSTGNTFSLSSLSGKKAILIDFWASDCGPCRGEHPMLKGWYQKYAGKGLEIVSISIDGSKDKWLKAVKDDGIGSWVNVCDTSGFNAALMRDYYIPYIPFRFLLDANQNIILVDNKQDSWITEKDIAAILDK